MKIRDTPFFKTKPPILPTPSFLWEKSDPPPPFGESFINSNPNYVTPIHIVNSVGPLFCIYL